MDLVLPRKGVTESESGPESSAEKVWSVSVTSGSFPGRFLRRMIATRPLNRALASPPAGGLSTVSPRFDARKMFCKAKGIRCPPRCFDMIPDGLVRCAAIDVSKSLILYAKDFFRPCDADGCLF